MTISRAALYIGGASLLVAWLSSAASLSLEPGAPAAAPPAAGQDVDVTGARVLERARQLRERLAEARAPEPPRRNPFAFRVEQRPPAERVRAAARAIEPAILPPPEPRLMLVGVSEEKRPEGLVKKAMLATERDELILAAVGDVVLGRYTVTAITFEAIEMTDAATGAGRRIELQMF